MIFYANRKAAGFAFFFIIILVWPMTLLITKCSEMPGSPALQQGQRVLYQMAGKANLEQVGFFKNTNGSPNAFMTMITDENHVLWPPEMVKKDHDPRPTSNRIPLPVDLVFSAGERKHLGKDELVYLADDAQQKLVLRGYIAGSEEKAFEYIWDFPTPAGRIPLLP